MCTRLLRILQQLSSIPGELSSHTKQGLQDPRVSFLLVGLLSVWATLPTYNLGNCLTFRTQPRHRFWSLPRLSPAFCAPPINDQELVPFWTLLHCWWECKLVQPLWKTVWRFLKEQKIVTIWSSSPTPRHISGQNSNSKRYMHPNVHCSTIYNSQDMETTEMSIDRGMDKEDVVHIYSGILLSHKKRMK